MSGALAPGADNELYFCMPHDDYVEKGHLYTEEFYDIVKANRIVWWVDILDQDNKLLDAVPFATHKKAAKYLDDCIKFGYHGKYNTLVCTPGDPLDPNSGSTAYQLCIKTTPYNTRLHSTEKEEDKS